ncbi:hypothetical protein [Ferdinandcohnia sp. SAFN-114]|uniref:hypothetical protein n=1 Tax=Ferdinandcohnia sp. SAFN-114 TaxID=3387275 RepID=UPI003F7D5F94
MKAPISDNEQNLIYEYIFHTYLLECLEYNRMISDQAGLKIVEAYQSLHEHILKKVRMDIKTMVELMKKLNIRVFSPVRLDDMFIEVKYTAHGYEGAMKFWDKALDKHAANRLEKYMGNPNPRQW